MKFFKIVSLVFLVLCLVLTLQITTVFAGNLELEKVKLKLNWIPGGDHSFYFVAKELGYYQDNGLDVTIERGQGSLDTVSKVDVGTVEIGLADTPTAIIVRSKGAKVKIIAMVYSNSPNGIKTRPDTGIKEPKDLEGHTVGVPAGDAQRTLWPAFAKLNEIDMEKVTLVNVAPGAKFQMLGAKKVDAVFDWVVGNIPYWETFGKDNLVLIPWSNWGLNPYGNAIIASEDTIKNNPEMISKFLDATLKAWQWTIKNPEEAIKILQKDIPEVGFLTGLSRLVEDIYSLVDSEPFRSHGLGYIDHQRMQDSINIIDEYFKLESKVKVEDMFTTEFLPYYEMPSLENVITVEEAWEKYGKK